MDKKSSKNIKNQHFRAKGYQTRKKGFLGGIYGRGQKKTVLGGIYGKSPKKSIKTSGTYYYKENYGFSIKIESKNYRFYIAFCMKKGSKIGPKSDIKYANIE